MNKISIFLLALFCMAGLFSICENPPSGPWIWNADDSVAIAGLLDEEAEFLCPGDLLGSQAVTFDITTEMADNLIEDTSSVRYFVSEISFEVTDTVSEYNYTLGVDTTVTVDVADTLKGKVYLQVDSLLSKGSTEFSVTDTTLEKTLRFASWNGVFADSTDASWYLAKFSGALEGTAPSVAMAPRIDSVSLRYPGGSKRVLPSASPGEYAVDGLYEVDDLIGVNPGEQITVDEIFSDDNLIFFISKGSEWIPYTPGTGLTFSTTGKSRIYVIGMSVDAVAYSSTEWDCIVWGIPVIVE